MDKPNETVLISNKSSSSSLVFSLPVSDKAHGLKVMLPLYVSHACFWLDIEQC